MRPHIYEVVLDWNPSFISYKLDESAGARSRQSVDERLSVSASLRQCDIFNRFPIGGPSDAGRPTPDAGRRTRLMPQAASATREKKIKRNWPMIDGRTSWFNRRVRNRFIAVVDRRCARIAFSFIWNRSLLIMLTVDFFLLYKKVFSLSQRWSARCSSRITGCSE